MNDAALPGALCRDNRRPTAACSTSVPSGPHVQFLFSRTRPLQVEPVHGGTRGEPCDDLQCEHPQRLSRSSREPFQREVHHNWYLPGHEQLPEMSRGTLVGFMRDAEY